MVCLILVVFCSYDAHNAENRAVQDMEFVVKVARMSDASVGYPSYRYNAGPWSIVFDG